MIPTVYVLATRNCNLNCPFCDIKDTQKEKFDLEAIKNQMDYFYDNDPNTNFILFGGEPLLYSDRWKSLLATERFQNITTNLCLDLTEFLEFIDENKLKNSLTITTSWGLERFTVDQYKLWRSNLDKIKSPFIIITMTENLIKMNPSDFMSMIRNWPSCEIKFEPLIDPTKNEKFYTECDWWLCSLARIWNLKTRRVINFYNPLFWHDCTDTHTIGPDGTVYFSECPHSINESMSFCNKCLDCKFNEKCKPCRLQTYCFCKNLNNELSTTLKWRRKYFLGWE